jgi:NAD(P)-dependent dehydrogenase (short-subunit alcohol dehydrogenase family)
LLVDHITFELQKVPSKAAATRHGRMGVRVNAVFPGIIETPMTQKSEESKELVNQMI